MKNCHTTIVPSLRKRRNVMVKKLLLATIVLFACQPVIQPAIPGNDNALSAIIDAIPASIPSNGLLDQDVTLTASLDNHRYKPSGKNFFKRRGAPLVAASPQQNNNSETDIYQWLKTYSEIISLIEKKSFRNVEFPNFIQNSLKSAVSHIDAHSSFFSQDNYKAAMETTSGEFSGIGISIISKTPDDDALVIIDVIQGGPADKAGLKGGDKIVDVDGTKLRGLSSDEVITKLKGKVGSKVALKIIRKKKPMEFTATRDIIQDHNALCYFFKNQKVYYLCLKLFTENAASNIAELLEKANQGKCKGIVLDLRRNPGGMLDSAIEMASLFIPKKSLVVVTKDRDRNTVSEYYTNSDPMLKSSLPIFILIDNFTASAAEILAGCLRHYSQKSVPSDPKKPPLMVFLVGNETFGKGSVQEVIPVSNGCALKLTTMLYYLPENISIQACGIKPDFTIKPKLVPVDEIKWVEDLYGKETSLANHITVKEVAHNNHKESNEKDNDGNDEVLGIKANPVTLKKKHTKKDDEVEEKNWEEKQREDLALDVQVQTSVNLINLLSLAKKANPRIATDRNYALSYLKKHYITDDIVDVEKIK